MPKSDWKKDYGMYLLKSAPNKSRLPDIYLPQFVLYNLAALEPGAYTTTADLPVGNETYAVTVDFDQDVFEKILAAMPKGHAEKLRDVVDRIVDYPAMIRMEGGVCVGLKARLGTLQHGSGEDFIPLVAFDVIRV